MFKGGQGVPALIKNTRQLKQVLSSMHRLKIFNEGPWDLILILNFANHVHQHCERQTYVPAVK